ncbi:MAG: hypothetical protein HZY79_02190 [Rhodoblastus sp.]|nr:MAG: hypothetical protein HZY79_02190 [Rhodoblastus sp.]
MQCLEEGMANVEPGMLEACVEAVDWRMRNDPLFAILTDMMAFSLCGEPLEGSRAFLLEGFDQFCASPTAGPADRAFHAAHTLKVWDRLLDMTRRAGMA